MDLIAITETWLTIGEKDNTIIRDLTPADYKFVHLPRKSRRGVGVGLVYRSSFKVVVNRRDDMKSFEFVDVDVSSYGNSMKLVIIYRPHPSKKNKHSYADVLFEFTGFIEHYALMTTRFAIVGDFNIHWDVPSDNNVKRFADLLESLNIIQHVHAPTHIDGHTIDLILTPSGNHGITSTTKTTLLLSDHLWVLKKANIDQDNTNSYRPISNLPFVSKLLERYLLDHMTANNLLERYQSAYKSHHSTETALVLVQNDILGALWSNYSLTRHVGCLRHS